MSSTLREQDRVARGYERAVLATTSRTEPLVLDRTLESIAGASSPLQKYLELTPGSDPSSIAAYLRMVLLTTRGRDSALDAFEPFEQWISQLDELAARIAKLPMRGAPWVRPRTLVTRIQAQLHPSVVERIAQKIRGVVPHFEGAEVIADEGWDEYEDWEWSQALDYDEERIDIAFDGLRITVTRDEPAEAERIAFELFDELGEEYEYSKFGVAYDTDEPASDLYMRDGFDGGLPRLLFFAYGIVPPLLAKEPRHGKGDFVAVRPTRAMITELGLSGEWPHYVWPDD